MIRQFAREGYPTQVSVLPPGEQEMKHGCSFSPGMSSSAHICSERDRERKSSRIYDVSSRSFPQKFTFKHTVCVCVCVDS